MSFKFSFKSIEVCRLSQFERKVVPNGWRCDAKSALRCNRLSSWYFKGRPVAGSQRSTWRECVKDDMNELGLNSEWVVFRDMWRSLISGKTSDPS